MIKFRHIEKEDIEKITQYITNSQVSKYLTWKVYKNNNEIKKYLNYAFSCKAFPDEILSIIFQNDVIGTVHLINRNNKTVQIGFGILPEFWNMGLGYKIASEILLYIKNSKWSQESKQVWVVIHKENIFAQKIFKKLKFHPEEQNIKENFDRYVLKLFD